jgi:hypothetical protein
VKIVVIKGDSLVYIVVPLPLVDFDCQITDGNTPADNSNGTAPNYGNTAPLIYGRCALQGRKGGSLFTKKIELAKVVGS